MVSLLNSSLIGFFVFIIVIVQATPLLETSNDINENKSPISNQELYELYKTMRTDPRLASVSNHDIVSYIYQNFILGNGEDINFIKPKHQNNRRHRYQKPVQAE